MNQFILVYITCPTRKSADELAQSLLEKRLAACANIIPVLSRYHWQGKIESDNEVLILLKTRAELFEAICTLVNREHPYDVPEIVAVPIFKGSVDYLDWIRKETEKGEGIT